MDYFKQAGKVALGSRLRRLGEMFRGDAADIYSLYQVELKPNWFPVFHLLAHYSESSITQMARDIGYSHPVISLIVKDMTKAGLTQSAKSAADGRLNVVRLTGKGRKLIPKLENQMQDVEDAVNDLLTEMETDIWQGIKEMEQLLKSKSLLERVARKHEQRQTKEKRNDRQADEI